MSRSTWTYTLMLISLGIGSTGLWQGCGDPPATAVPQVGSIRVEAWLPPDTMLARPVTTLADSVNIVLDFDTLGTVLNPHTIENVATGTHWLALSYLDSIAPDSVVHYQYSITDTVALEHLADTARILLIREGPYPGNPAPPFALYDLDTNLVSLPGTATGKITLLYFFEST